MNARVQQRDIAEAQVRFRAENEAIQASADTLAMLGPIPFVCECPDPACTEIVRMTFDAYEAIRQDRRRFFSISGHEQASVAAGAERVVAVAGDLTIVDKIGLAGDLAAGEPYRAAG